MLTAREQNRTLTAVTIMLNEPKRSASYLTAMLLWAGAQRLVVLDRLAEANRATFFFLRTAPNNLPVSLQAKSS